jgi:hypothetical protein
LKQPDERRQKYLGLAWNEIRSTAQLYPDLGGEAWRGRYDRLLKRIQRDLGKPQVGLEEFASRAAGPGA